MMEGRQNRSDESIEKRWAENSYHQFLSEKTVFHLGFPCYPADLVYFRKRIGKGDVTRSRYRTRPKNREKAFA